MNTLFVLSYNFLCTSKGTPCSFLCRELLGYILGNTLACVRNVGLFCSVRQFDISDKTVIYNDSLRSTLACTLCFKNINMVNQFSKQRWCQIIHLHKLANCRYEFFIFRIGVFNSSILYRVSAILAFKSIRSFLYLWDNSTNHSSLTFPITLLIWTKGAKMHTQNWRVNKNYLGKFLCPLLVWTVSNKSQGISAKNLQKNKVPRFLKVQKAKDWVCKNI